MQLVSCLNSNKFLTFFVSFLLKTMHTYTDSHLFLAFRVSTKHPLTSGPKMKQTTNAFIAEWARPLNQLLLRRLPLRPPPQALHLGPRNRHIKQFRLCFSSTQQMLVSFLANSQSKKSTNFPVNYVVNLDHPVAPSH